MKIKNLIAIAALLMGSTNAFAAVGDLLKQNGIGYEVLTEPTAKAAGTVYVKGILKNANGNAIKAAKAVSIPASITLTIDDESKTYNVVALGDGWEVEATAPDFQDLSADIKSLTVDVTNFNAVGLETSDLDGFALETLKIVDNTKETETVKSTTQNLPAIPATVTSLDIENTCIKTIGGFAAKGIKTIKLPQALETISPNAFNSCAALEGTIVIPATVTSIGMNAFKDAAKADFDLSKAAALEIIYPYAFEGSGITTANLNACVKLTDIKDNAFKDCVKLTKLQMSGIASLAADKQVLKTIGVEAFAGTKIAAANLPASVTTLGTGAFKGCKELTQVSAMAGLTAIPADAFKDAEKLASVSIAKGVASIGANAFDGCKALATVTVKTDDKGVSALASIGKEAFKNCEALTAIDLSSTQIASVDGNANAWFIGTTALAEVKLPATVTSIGEQAFGDCVIENLDLSNTKITQLNAIFRHSDKTYPDAKKPYASLKSIKLPETLQSIYDYSGVTNNGVFSYCTSLEEIDIPTEFENFAADGAVPAYAFYYCTSLKNVNYEPTFKSVYQVFNDEAFLGCTPFVNINTNSYYYTTYKVPTNATFGSTKLTIKTVADKGTSGKFFAKFCPVSACRINPADAKVYSVYVDQGVAYLQALIKRNGMYQINAGDHVIVKTDEAKEITATPVAYGLTASVTVDDVFSLADDTPTADVHDNTSLATYGPAWTFAPVVFNAGSDYIYRLTNNAATGGFGFTFFSGATMKADQFFIISNKNPNAGGRLQTVWLDENGFVEEDGATAIQKVEAAEAENGAIYNLQGVRVKAAKKGLYIQNGKKYIMK